MSSTPTLSSLPNCLLTHIILFLPSTDGLPDLASTLARTVRLIHRCFTAAIVEAVARFHCMKHLEAVKSALTSQEIPGYVTLEEVWSPVDACANSKAGYLYALWCLMPRVSNKKEWDKEKEELVPGKTTTLELHLPKGCTYLTPVTHAPFSRHQVAVVMYRGYWHLRSPIWTDAITSDTVRFFKTLMAVSRFKSDWSKAEAAEQRGEIRLHPGMIIRENNNSRLCFRCHRYIRTNTKHPFDMYRYPLSQHKLDLDHDSSLLEMLQGILSGMREKETVEQKLKRCRKASSNGPTSSPWQEPLMREQILHMYRETLGEYIEGMNGWQCLCKIFSKEIEEKIRFRRSFKHEESSDSEKSSDEEETEFALGMFADEDGEGDY